MEIVICIVVYLLSVLGVWLINHYKFQSTEGEVLFICLMPILNTAALFIFGVLFINIVIANWESTHAIETFNRKFFKLK